MISLDQPPGLRIMFVSENEYFRFGMRPISVAGGTNISRFSLSRFIFLGPRSSVLQPSERMGSGLGDSFKVFPRFNSLMYNKGKRFPWGNTMRILVIEDDRNISFAINRFLSVHGHEVTCCYNLTEAYKYNPNRQDFIIIDLNLPDGDGFEYLDYVRSGGIRVPLLIITVRDQEGDVVRGLEMGADDYLTKPFSLPVLKARMDAILRRAGFDCNVNRIKCGKLELDKATKTVFLENKMLDLTAKEYELLELFMENQGLILPRQKIIDLLWGWERGDVYDNTLTVTVKRLREKIAPYQGYIHTVRGIGYRLTGGDE